MRRPPKHLSLVGKVLRGACAASLLLLASGCGGLKEKVTEKVGTSGFWHLERTQTSRFWAWLNSIGFIARHLSDAGYRGERWWFVAPNGQHVFARLL
ncbi:MAG TPA: hypothetical protein VE979_02970, partial [Streptosporangiaceae bacterium]|nr:hypothetical protein [Streptosporangiaceae bacterium]